MKIIKIKTEQVTPGMKAAEDVYTYNNQLIITANTVLTDKIITRLRFYSVTDIKIAVEDNAPDEIPAVPMREQTYLQKKRESTEFRLFLKDMEASVNNFKTNLKMISEKTPTLDTDLLVYDVKSVLSKCRNGIQVFDLLHCMRDNQDQTYQHSINVAMVSAVIGKWLKLPSADLDVLMLCGLLHDIGKLTIPSEILLKPGKLTSEEYDAVKSHAMHGYNYLRPKNIDSRIKLAAMTHHERCDGSGYPMGLIGSQLDDFSKIVAIADVYDAMTSARVYRGPMCPFEVLHIFESEGLSKFDTRILMTFMEHITKSYLGNTVQLNNGKRGTIILMNPTSISKPVIQCGTTYIDLSRESNIYIEKLL